MVTETQNEKNEQAGILVVVDPRDLIADRNIREETLVDPDLVASIKDVGVLQPIVAVRAAGVGDEPVFRVRFGHRRTLAAIEAELPMVPVYVIGDEATSTPAEIERLLGQYAENEHRAPLTTADRVNVVHQLALLKVSPTQIAKRTRMARADVDHAVAVGKSTTARDLTRHTDTTDNTDNTDSENTGELTLEHLAAIAEFEDDPDAVQKLIRAAHSYGFTHTLAGLRSSREEAKERAVEAAKLEKQGLRVVVLDRSTEAGKLIQRLDLLTDANGEELTVDTHARCPGHVAWPIKDGVWIDAGGNELPDDDDEGVWSETDDEDDVDDPYADARHVQRWRPEYGCEDWAAHGHIYIFSQHQGNGKLPTSSADAAGEKTEAEKEAERIERRRVIAGNKQWDTAVGVRRRWLRQFLTRKTPPAGSVEFIAQAVAHADHPVRQAFERNHPLAAELFGLDMPDNEPAYLYGRHREAVVGLLDGATEKRQTVITLGLLLAGYEASLHRMSWRGDGYSDSRRYLRFLADHGYELCNTERLAAGLPTEDNGDEIHTD